MIAEFELEFYAEAANFIPFNKRAEFQVIQPGGDYVRFTGTLPDGCKVNAEGTADVSIEDIEILERGNLFIGHSADELPQVSV